MGKHDETAPKLLNIGDAHTYDCGLKLSFTGFQIPDLDEETLKERARDSGQRGSIDSLNFFQADAVVENVGSKQLKFSLHYQYHYARVGDPARQAAGLDISDGALFDVVLHPGRRLAGYFVFASKKQWGDRVEIDSKIYLDPSLTTLSSVWAGRLPAGPGSDAAPVTTAHALTASQPVSGSAATVIAAEAEMRKRDEGKRIALENPRLALELGIGDPDRHAGFDDGGLIDINGVDAEALSRAFRLSPDAASRIVGARARVSGVFTSVEEIVLYAELSSREEQLLRERAVVLPW
ncbi:hypothetical protein [Streptomyces sp. NBC_01022]|uniref:hypothetical protein n=1 Tax=Streptomyces sp. NBC_01022 TaxID=2903723 RepID=UPI002DDB154B|nr:hypothetical protein [Streptomyces sp. NBC_01022]WRZ82662.1 hypothetical protein OG316_21560 [Streptomyces sp. NBC_01022]